MGEGTARPARLAGYPHMEEMSAEGIESARERNFNHIDRSRRHVLPCFRCNAARTACKRHGKFRSEVCSSGVSTPVKLQRREG